MNDPQKKEKEFMQILVVDDTPASLKLLTDILTDKGYYVRPASSGRLAIRSAEMAAPDLILLDVLMPDMDGYEVCIHLKNNEQTRDIPIIFISSLEQVTDKVHGFQVGAVDFISKPIEAEEMLARVETHLSLRRLQNKLEVQNQQLEDEIIEREQKEDELQQYKANLEKIVLERTEEIREINRELELRNIILSTQQESTIDGILVIDESGRVISANQRFRNIFGIPVEIALSRLDDLIKEFIRNLWPGSDPDLQRIFQLTSHAKGISHTECSLIDRRIIEIYSSPLIDTKGTDYGRVWFFRDISSRKKMENLLRDKTEELDRFFSLNIDLLSIASKSGYFLRLNPEWRHVLGYSIKELTASKYIEFVHPEDQESTRKTAEISQDKKILRFINRYRHKDGSYRWIEWSSVPYKDLIYASARDITERILTEQTLQESEQRYRFLLDAITDYIFTVYIENDSPIRTIHGPGCLAVTGYSPEDFVTDPLLWLKMVVSEDQQIVTDQISMILSERESLPIEHRIIRKDGEVRWVRNTIVRRYGTVGSLLAYDGLIQDISERKQAEQELRKSEERFRTMVEQSPLSIQVLSPDGHTIQINHAFEELWGITLVDLDQYNILSDQQLIKLGLMGYIRKGFDGESASIPAAQYDVSKSVGKGEKRWVQSQIYPVRDVAGTISNIIIVHEDITDKKQVEKALTISEEKYRTLVENIHIGVYQIKADMRGKFLWVNQAMVTVFGYDSPDDFLRISAIDLYINPEDRKKYLELVFREGYVRDYKIQMKKRDTTRIWVSVTSHIRYGPDGSILWIDGILEDVTANYQIEELKWKAFSQIDKNMEQFAILNDQIRNPLSIILTYVSESDIPKKEIIEEQVNNIDHLINLLDKGYLESEKVSEFLRKHQHALFNNPIQKKETE